MTDEKVKGVERLSKAVAQGAVGGAIVGSTAGAEAAIAGAGLGGIAGGAKELIDLAAEHIATSGADRRLLEADERLRAQALEEHRERIEDRLEELREAVGEREAASTVVPTLRAWSRAWGSADGKKQRVIMAALVSAFDPESHEQAMSRKFFRLIEVLDYPEIHLLCSLYGKIEPDRFGTWHGTDDLAQGTKGWYLIAELERHGLFLLSQSSTKHFGPTWLGQEFAAFLRRGDFLGSDATESETDHDDPESAPDEAGRG